MTRIMLAYVLWLVACALLLWHVLSVVAAQVTQPAPATVCYVTDGVTARLSWMDLGPLERQYVTNRASVSSGGGVTTIRHEIDLRGRDVSRVFLPKVPHD